MQHMRFRHRLGISIHAPREGCDRIVRLTNPHGHISIHAPREGCDTILGFRAAHIQISIHAPREGCDG